MQNLPIILFGEVLFDQFPDASKILGGAPFNVAWHLQAFGQQPQFISRVGDDASGAMVYLAMQQWGMSLATLQQDTMYSTGQVQISMEHGEPRYAILANQAYDYIEDQGLETISSDGILYHGTLALRSPASRKTLQILKARQQGKIFLDVNLREPWWSQQEVLALFNDADWVKLNVDEFRALQLELMHIETSMKQVLDQYELEGIIVTCAEQGALALNKLGEFIKVSASNAGNIVDTVGAGDAFSAVILLGLNRGWSLQESMEKAEQFASAVIGQRGAIIPDMAFYKVLESSLLQIDAES